MRFDQSYRSDFEAHRDSWTPRTFNEYMTTLVLWIDTVTDKVVDPLSCPVLTDYIIDAVANDREAFIEWAIYFNPQPMQKCIMRGTKSYCNDHLPFEHEASALIARMSSTLARFDDEFIPSR